MRQPAGERKSVRLKTPPLGPQDLDDRGSIARRVGSGVDMGAGEVADRAAASGSAALRNQRE